MTETLPSEGELLAVASDSLGDASLSLAVHRLPSIRAQANGERSTPIIEALMADLTTAKKMIYDWQFEAWERMLLLHTPSSDPVGWKNVVIECTYCEEPWPCHEMTAERAYLDKSIAERGLLDQYEKLRTEVIRLQTIPNPQDIDDLLGAHVDGEPCINCEHEADGCAQSLSARVLVRHLKATLRATVTADSEARDRLQVHGERVAEARIAARLQQTRRAHLRTAAEHENAGNSAAARISRLKADTVKETIAAVNGSAL